MRQSKPIVALVGRPNVGKSSIFNRLAKKKKAIVDSTPGVTRDRHYENVTWDEREFLLVDTGGLESDWGDSMAGLIQDQTVMAIKEADVIIFVLDGKEGLSVEDYRVTDMLRRTDKPVYFVVNKVDGEELEEKLLPQFYEIGADTLWPVSAAHGYGIVTFFDHLVRNFKVNDCEADLAEDVIRVAFLGRPNVGKSSLVNRLLGQDRMVVSSIPGTTRDAVDTLCEHGSGKYLLIDTAGIRRKGKVQDKLEKFSVLGALRTLERCDIALILIDAKEGITEQDTKVIGYCQERGRACLVLLNKWDLIKDDKRWKKYLADEVERSTRFVGFAPTISVSALTGMGVKKIFSEVKNIYKQYGLEFTTNKLNKILQKAVLEHSPSLYRGRRIKLYYTTQVATKPPTFIVFANYPKGIHFSYFRFLVNRFREGLGLEKSPLRIFLRERERKKYG